VITTSASADNKPAFHQQQQQKPGIATGAIVGIAIGAIAVLVFLLSAALYYVRRCASESRRLHLMAPASIVHACSADDHDDDNDNLNSVTDNGPAELWGYHNSNHRAKNVAELANDTAVESRTTSSGTGSGTDAAIMKNMHSNAIAVKTNNNVNVNNMTPTNKAVSPLSAATVSADLRRSFSFVSGDSPERRVGLALTTRGYVAELPGCQPQAV